MLPLDTTPDAAALQDEAHRQLGPAGRLKIALDLSDFTHRLAIAGIRQRHPELSEEEARRRLAEMLYTSAAVTR